MAGGCGDCVPGTAQLFLKAVESGAMYNAGGEHFIAAAVVVAINAKREELIAERILTSHAGSLTRPDDLADMFWARRG